MPEEKIFFQTTYDLGGEKLVATVYEGGACAVLEWFGPRGGLQGMVVAPGTVLADCLYAINDPNNIAPEHLTQRALDASPQSSKSDKSNDSRK